MSDISNFEKYISKVDKRAQNKIKYYIKNLIEKNPQQSVSITGMRVEDDKLIVSFDMTYCVSHCDDGGDVIVSKRYAIFDL